jgi:hypothetical protein
MSRAIRMTAAQAMRLSPTLKKAQAQGKIKIESVKITTKKVKQPKQPNKTEGEYKSIHLRGKDARYEAVSFKLANGHRYTPDWVVVEGGKITECHEVKGAFRHASHNRAQVMFDQARLEYPGIRWLWATKKKSGWEVRE